MPIKIAIPEPSSNYEYNRRSLPSYLTALKVAGAEPVLVPLASSQEAVARLAADTQAILLPGSRFDLDPQIYGQARLPECAPSDPSRHAVDELLLQDAFNLQKPILAICGGMQSLNVWRGGSLFQHLRTQINHSPGREVVDAHTVRVRAGTRLARLAAAVNETEPWVNSSHHQAIDRVGDNLQIAAVSPMDGVIEGVELDSEGHFVVAVQWHPERTYDSCAFSKAIFAEFVRATGAYEPRPVRESVTAP